MVIIPRITSSIQRLVHSNSRVHMTRTILFTVLITFSSTCVFSQKDKLTTDELAIKMVIEAESEHFWGRDLKAWKQNWVHKDYVIWRAASRDGVRQYNGWKAWYNEVKNLFKESPDPMPYEGKVEKLNYNFRIYGDGAWVSFEQLDEGTRTFETRIMEKVNGQWRIAMVSLMFDMNAADQEKQVDSGN